MIFVTVGGHPYDNLIREIDRLIETGEIEDEVIAQIADGEYIPKNIEFFDFKYPLTPYYKMADIIIATEGAGTTFEVLNEGKKLITIVGSLTVDNPDIVKYFSQNGYCIWCKELKYIVECVNEAERKKFRKYNSPPCKIHTEIEKFLKNAV
jgi:UDP-N-acetylglucosamine transferase subunit ALG13